MKTLKELLEAKWKIGSAHYQTPICSSPLWQQHEIEEAILAWLQQYKESAGFEADVLLNELLADVEKRAVNLISVVNQNSVPATESCR